MNTELFILEEKKLHNQIDEIAAILKKGGLVAIPTETVYGLAANIFDEQAVKNIYRAKGRPSDNPLIVHVSDLEMAKPLIKKVPKHFFELADHFWPGPLTMVVEKTQLVNNTVSGGLNTVAIRMPSHEIANKIIASAGVPLAAPSANLSGRPSTTAAQHVIADLNGKIDAIAVGEDCKVGIESTVISLVDDKVTLLRPGIITPEQIKGVTGEITIANAVKEELKNGEKALSPGMKYKHYAPLAKVILLESDNDTLYNFIKKEANEDTAFAVYKEHLPFLQGYNVYSLGDRDDYYAVSAKLFGVLRKADEDKVNTLYVLSPPKSGEFLGVYNRMLRAAGFQIKKL